MGDSERIARLEEELRLLKEVLTQSRSPAEPGPVAPRSAGYLEPVTSVHPTKIFLIPQNFPDAGASHRFPTDGVGRHGEPHLLTLRADVAFSHAQLNNKQREAQWYRQVASAVAYQELCLLQTRDLSGILFQLVGYAANQLAHAQERLADLAPLAADADEEARVAHSLLSAKLEAQAREAAALASQLATQADNSVLHVNTEEGVQAILLHSESLLETYLSPPGVVPKHLAEAIEKEGTATGGFSTRDPHLARVAASYRTNFGLAVAKESARKAAGYQPRKGGAPPPEPKAKAKGADAGPSAKGKGKAAAE